jgi:SAM-dependent methyltransferase
MESNTPDDIFFQPDIYESQFAYVDQFTDIPFWRGLANQFGPKCLELACGNGRSIVPLLENGIDIDGVDFSQGMLERARKKAEEKSLMPTLFLGDIRDLRLTRRYDFAFLPSGTISHLVNSEEPIAFLAGAHRILRPNGVLAIDGHNPEQTFLRTLPIDDTPQLSEFRIKSTNELVRVTAFRSYSPAEKLFALRMVYRFASGDRSESSLRLRLYNANELVTLVEGNGFRVDAVWGDYQNSPFGPSCKKYVIVARKCDVDRFEQEGSQVA